MKITLVAKPDNPSLNFLIEDLPFLIGRDEAPFSEFANESKEMRKAVYHISRRHAEFYEDQGKILVRDLGSKNGTRINGRKLGADPAEIKNGDSVRITQTFEYKLTIETEDKISEGVPFSLTLIPEDSQSGLSAIDISTYPFDIGRMEESFREYESMLPDQVGSLSRKHARITYCNNQVFIQDLGSTNGTTLSGDALGQTPKPINHGDQIIFGQFFRYTVRLIGEDVEETIALESVTIKEPDRTIVTGSKNISMATADVMDTQGKSPIDAMTPPPPNSGKNVVYLGATHSKDSMPDIASEVENAGQNVSESVDDAPAEDKAANQQSGTVYMSSATQFLKILTSDEKAESTEKDTDDGPAPDTDKPTASVTKKSRIIGLAKEIFSTLSAGSTHAKRNKWLVTGFLTVITVAAVWWIVASRMPEQKLKKLMATGQYVEYVKLADQVLAKNPGNEDIRRVSTEALMRAILKDFTEALRQGRVESAKEIIGSYAAYTPNNPDAQKTLHLLSWIVDLETYFVQNDPDRPINLFRDEAIIEPIVTQWDENEDDYRFLMDQMVQRSDVFKSMRGLVYHHLNVLELKSIYFDSVKKLNRTIQNKMDGQRNEEILTAIDEYKRKYPGIEGLLELRKEAENYQRLHQLIRSRNVVELSTYFNTVEFQTPVFKQKVDDLKKNILPDPEMGLKIKTAGQAWAKGDTDQAFTILEGLIGQRWGDIAETKLDHYRQVIALVAKVNSTKGSPEHSTHLLALRRIIDPQEDQYFAQQVAGDFAGLRDQELRKSQTMMDKAAQQWAEYAQSGRITGLLRLESTISNKFKQRANQLKTCFELSRSGVQIYKTLDIQLPDQWERLNTQITDEVIAQRLRIEDLSGVLGKEVSTAKLALLPQP